MSARTPGAAPLEEGLNCKPQSHCGDRVDRARHGPQPQRGDQREECPQHRIAAPGERTAERQQQQEREHHERVAARVRRVLDQRRRGGHEGGAEQRGGPAREQRAAGDVGGRGHGAARQERREPDRPRLVPEQLGAEVGQHRVQDVVVLVGVEADRDRERLRGELGVRVSLVVAHRVVQEHEADGHRSREQRCKARELEPRHLAPLAAQPGRHVVAQPRERAAHVPQRAGGGGRRSPAQRDQQDASSGHGQGHHADRPDAALHPVEREERGAVCGDPVGDARGEVVKRPRAERVDGQRRPDREQQHAGADHQSPCPAVVVGSPGPRPHRVPPRSLAALPPGQAQ